MLYAAMDYKILIYNAARDGNLITLKVRFKKKNKKNRFNL